MEFVSSDIKRTVKGEWNTLVVYLTYETSTGYDLEHLVGVLNLPGHGFTFISCRPGETDEILNMSLERELFH